MTQTTDNKDGGWKCDMKDEVTVDMDAGKMNTVCELKKDVMTHQTDFGTTKLLDDKFLLNPYFRFESDRSLNNKKVFLGGVSRWGEFMLRNQFAFKNSTDLKFDARLNYVHNNCNLTLSKSCDLINVKLLNWRLLTGYEDNTYSSYLEVLKESGNNWANWARVHLGYKMCDNFDVALSLHQNVETTTERKMDLGFRYKLDKNTEVKQKVNCNLDTSCFMKHKLNDSTWMLFTMSTNLRNLGSSTQSSGYKGFMNYPFNYGFKLKVDN